MSSSFVFTGTNFSAEENVAFPVGELEYFNGSTYTGTEIDSVELCIQATITAPTAQVVTGCRNIYIINSPNVPDPIASADSVTMKRGPDFFVLEGKSAKATVLAEIKDGLGVAGQSQLVLGLEIVRFGEITSGDGFLKQSIYLPIVFR